MIPKSGNRIPAYAKPASAGEGKSDKIMLMQRMSGTHGRRNYDADTARLFHGIMASSRAMPQKPLTPANTNPAPTKPDSA